jgi:EAL domain-containing protein (putative c-di-GMP-specific phosphodiesterase class I)
VTTEPAGFAFVEQCLQKNGQCVGARLGEHVLSSAFQPIYSVSHRRPVGYEGLLRAKTLDGRDVAPLEVFRSCAHDQTEAVRLDRVCRAMHLRNFPWQDVPDSWLFLNVNPRVVSVGSRYGAFFQRLLESSGVAPERLVIEILENGITDPILLADTAAYFRDQGCLVAIDDFGAGHSNFDRVWQLGPDMVKLDRSLIARAARNPRVRRTLPSLVELIHESGSLVVIEGVETEDQALIALDANADLVQGYLFAKPMPQIGASDVSSLEPLCENLRNRACMATDCLKSGLDRHVAALANAADILLADRPLQQACRTLLQDPRVERCYLLDKAGLQVGQTLYPPGDVVRQDARFAPLASGEGASWVRRPYFRRAINEPGVVQTTRPYLSIAGATMCVTLSVAIATCHGPQVLCCDLSDTADVV